MKPNVKFYALIALLLSSLIALTSAQNRYRNQRASTNRNRSSNRNRNNEPVEQGRTLGLLSPLLNLGLNSLARPYVGVVGYDAPIADATPYRPSSSSPGSAQLDPYYGGYNPNYYPGYFGGYRIFRPLAFGGFPFPFFGAYRPPIYPVNYGGYPQYNGYGGQRPVYGNPRPYPIAQRPNLVSQPAINTPSPANIRPSTPSGTSTPQINSAQAAQVANLLGQLLGQQLRPLLNAGTAAAPANDVPGIEPVKLDDKCYRNSNCRN